MIAFNPSRMLYGPDFKTLLAEAAIRLRLGSHALIVTSEQPARDGTVPMLRDCLEDEGVESILYDRVSHDAASDTIEEVSSLASDGRADCIIGVGPPVILDFARIAGLAASTGKHVYRLIDEPDGGGTGESLPFLAVPTRCWNPLLFSEFAVIKDAREGAARSVRTSAYPDTVFYLSGIVGKLTGKQTVYDLLCVFSDCVEVMGKTAGSVGHPLVSDATAQVVSILRSIPTSDTPPDRGKIQVAGIHSAWLLSSPGAGFALGRSAHSRTGVSPEWVTAALLPQITGHRAAENPILSLELRQILGLEPTGNGGEETEQIEMEVRSLTALADVPLRLRDLGLASEMLEGIAGCAAGICDTDEEALLAFLKNAL